MSSAQYRRQLEAKRRQRVDAEKPASDFRRKEADKRAAASKAVESASRTSSASIVSSRLREAGRHESEANFAGKEAARWQSRGAAYGREEAALQSILAKAEQTERDESDRRRKCEQQAADRRAAAERASIYDRLYATETLVTSALRELRAQGGEAAHPHAGGLV